MAESRGGLLWSPLGCGVQGPLSRPVSLLLTWNPTVSQTWIQKSGNATCECSTHSASQDFIPVSRVTYFPLKVLKLTSAGPGVLCSAT